MGFYSEIDKKIKEHGFSHVLFDIQVAWMATLDESKKSYWIKMTLVILMSPLFIFLGYGEIGDKIAQVGMASYDHPLSNLIATMFLFMHWAGVIFPYIFALNIICLFTTKMWSNYFWEQVEKAKQI